MSVEQRGHISQIMINAMHTFKTAQGNTVHKHVASITGVILRLSFFFFFFFALFGCLEVNARRARSASNALFT